MIFSSKSIVVNSSWLFKVLFGKKQLLILSIVMYALYLYYVCISLVSTLYVSYLYYIVLHYMAIEVRCTARLVLYSSAVPHLTPTHVVYSVVLYWMHYVEVCCLYYVVCITVPTSLGTGKLHLAPSKHIFNKCLLWEFLFVQIQILYENQTW